MTEALCFSYRGNDPLMIKERTKTKNAFTSSPFRSFPCCFGRSRAAFSLSLCKSHSLLYVLIALICELSVLSLILTFPAFDFRKSFFLCIITMKFSTALSIALVLLPALQVSAGPFRSHKAGHAAGNQKAGNSSSSASPSSTAATPAASKSSKVNVANNKGGGNIGVNNGGNNGGGNNNGDPQTSLSALSSISHSFILKRKSSALDPAVLCQGCEQDGQNPPVAGMRCLFSSSCLEANQ